MLTDLKKSYFNLARFWGAENPLGDELAKVPCVVCGKYSFAVQGGAVGSINLLSDLTDSASTVVIPDNAIIKLAYIDILTAMTSTAGTGTIALNAQSAGDLLAAVDADTLSGVVACIPVDTAATMIKLTADRTLTATVATNALLSGKFNLYVEYVLGD